MERCEKDAGEQDAAFFFCSVMSRSPFSRRAGFFFFNITHARPGVNTDFDVTFGF